MVRRDGDSDPHQPAIMGLTRGHSYPMPRVGASNNALSGTIGEFEAYKEKMTFSLATVFARPSDFGSLFIGFAHNVMHNVTL